MKTEHTIPRRKDRAIRDDKWIGEYLERSLFCTVATVLDGQPFLRPSAFHYSAEDRAIYIHGAHSGRTVDNVQLEDTVCLCAYSVGPLRTNTRAFDFFQEQAGVIVFGRATVLTDNARKHTAMQAMFEKHTPHLTVGVDYEPASQDEIDETTIHKISIDRWSGKMKWTEEPGRDRYNYSDIPEVSTPRLPWTHDMSDDEPLTAEWAQSRRGD